MMKKTTNLILFLVTFILTGCSFSFSTGTSDSTSSGLTEIIDNFEFVVDDKFQF